MKIFTAIATAAVIAAGFVATDATAQAVSTTVRVSYADLNLSSSAGMNTLTRRINAAANTACAVEPGQRDLTSKGNSARCHVAAVASARTAIAAATAPMFASR